MISRKIINTTVTFNPDINNLQKTLESILDNHVEAIVIDNGSKNQEEIADLISTLENITFIGLDKNRGIALAQNTGIKNALDKGAEFIWISDQDTTYPPDYISSMLECICSPNGINNAAAFGPAYIDTNRNEIQPFVTFQPFTKKFLPEPGQNIVSQLIASGMIVPAKSLEIVGLKQEDLFIDWVDFEWCWRAVRLHGMKIIGCGNVVISHTLGDQFVMFLGRKISIRSPFRHYFIVRNAIALALYSKSPSFAQRFEIFSKAIAWVLIYPLIAPTKKTLHLKATTVGLLHGLINKLGPKP